MTVRPQPGDPCWVELCTPDAGGAVDFYGALFGWDCTGAEPGGYRTFLHAGAPVAGLMADDGSTGPHTWSVYLASENAAHTVGRAREHGGLVVVEATPVGDLGHLAFVVDPAGASVGIRQPGQHPGFIRRGEIGAPAWFETLSTDYERSIAFYRDVFDWRPETMADGPDFRYTTLGSGEDARAGIMDATCFLGASPSRWQFYVEVADTDAIVEQTVATGGALAQRIEDTPYGRLAALVDPAGIAFCVRGPRRG